ncbi:hypothetical protein KSS87_007378 [Heliosperma pusillum]|nr:hypothetical protein KSS87_007378 [Heliosperma pusillum]
MEKNMLKMLHFLLVFFIEVVLIFGADKNVEQVNIWPLPNYVSNGNKVVYISNDFELKSVGSKYGDGLGLMKDGFLRLMNVITLDHVIDPKFSRLDQSVFLKGVNVVVHSSSDELHYDVDESYNLSIPVAGSGKPAYASIEANTVYGALHGLQTFSQLCQYNTRNRLVEIRLAPWTVIDEPRFPYRGLLIDTARHYLPLPVIKNVIDSMAYAKLALKGSDIVSCYYRMYAQKRGINVLAEVDVPGHASSWGNGYPSLWPSAACKEPLDVSNEFTFQVINGILSDFSKVFKYKFVHLGGDEVDTGCWEMTPHVARWEETFNEFGDKLDRRTVVHNWLGGGVAQQVTAAGLRCIVSNQDKWYLDHVDTTWDKFYMNEPLANITNPKHQNLVIGGEVCMWGERVDASDIQQTIWPQRLWTAYDKLATNPSKVARRLSHFRCLLNQRGIAAAPLFGSGRAAPDEPGSCFKQ